MCILRAEIKNENSLVVDAKSGLWGNRGRSGHAGPLHVEPRRVIERKTSAVELDVHDLEQLYCQEKVRHGKNGTRHTYTINAEVTDDDTLSDADSTTVLVRNVAPSLTLDPVPMIDEDGLATLTGTIQDPGTLDTFSLTINWGGFSKSSQS